MAMILIKEQTHVVRQKIQCNTVDVKTQNHTLAILKTTIWDNLDTNNS